MLFTLKMVNIYIFIYKPAQLLPYNPSIFQQNYTDMYSISISLTQNNTNAVFVSFLRGREAGRLCFIICRFDVPHGHGLLSWHKPQHTYDKCDGSLFFSERKRNEWRWSISHNDNSCVALWFSAARMWALTSCRCEEGGGRGGGGQGRKNCIFSGCSSVWTLYGGSGSQYRAHPHHDVSCLSMKATTCERLTKYSVGFWTVKMFYGFEFHRIFSHDVS